VRGGGYRCVVICGGYRCVIMFVLCVCMHACVRSVYVCLCVLAYLCVRTYVHVCMSCATV